MIRMDFGCTGGSGVCEYWFGFSVVVDVVDVWCWVCAVSDW
jgi:hypothetical protein